jgi:hypothetical protein
MTTVIRAATKHLDARTLLVEYVLLMAGALLLHGAAAPMADFTEAASRALRAGTPPVAPGEPSTKSVAWWATR